MSTCLVCPGIEPNPKSTPYEHASAEDQQVDHQS